MTTWNIEQARNTYSVEHWSEGYFDINQQGCVVARPDADAQQAGIDLYQLAHEVRQQGLTLPVLVRFTDILHSRVATLCDCFDSAMAQHDYQGGYTAVYPIKVNQQASVVQQIRNSREGRVGLEAGSKPELMAVLGMAREGDIIVCNGYKDREYIRLALIGKCLGLRVFIVIEKRSELELVIDEARRLNIDPLLGMRVRLASIGAGKWQNTGGEKSKFGLSAAQVISVVERLAEVGMQQCLQMLHFHLGSQLANIRDIQRGMQECARYFVELHGMQVDIRYVDVGGGLGVDYEGTRSRSACSMNYSVQTYASNIVHALSEACEQHEISPPHIMTESGRAMTAHHAVLITNVIDSEQVPYPETVSRPHDDAPAVLHDLWQCYESMLNQPSSRVAIEVYHELKHWLSEAQGMYSHGVLNLAHRAMAEEIYYLTCHKIKQLLSHSNRVQRELLDELNDKLADKYFCNFSLFQSLPDVWAIEQIFPVMPLHRLDEQPNRRGVLEDITCDSDGRINLYVDNEGIESSLPLHAFDKSDEYLLGIFMVGAYQEILGDMHNLFGDTDSVHVEQTTDGGYHFSELVHGDTVDSVLNYVHIDHQTLMASYRDKVASANLEPAQQEDFLQQLEQGLTGYTYLEDE